MCSQSQCLEILLSLCGHGVLGVQTDKLLHRYIPMFMFYAGE